MTGLAAALWLAALASAGADEALSTRQELKDTTRASVKATKSRAPEAGRSKAGAAFGDKERAAPRGGRVGRRIDPGFQVTSPGSPSATGKPLGLDGQDAPEIGVKNNVTPYQRELDEAKKAIETNSYRLVEGARDARDPSTPNTGRLSALSTVVIGAVVAIMGGIIAKVWGQSLQGSLIMAVGACIGAIAATMIFGAKPDPDRVQRDLQAAGASQRARIREDLSKAGGRVVELKDPGSSEEEE